MSSMSNVRVSKSLGLPSGIVAVIVGSVVVALPVITTTKRVKYPHGIYVKNVSLKLPSADAIGANCGTKSKLRQSSKSNDVQLAHEPIETVDEAMYDSIEAVVDATKVSN